MYNTSVSNQLWNLIIIILPNLTTLKIGERVGQCRHSSSWRNRSKHRRRRRGAQVWRHPSSSSDPQGIKSIFFHRDIGIARVLQHPLWNKKTLAHDIAILDLASKVEFRPGVVPACMPDNYHGRWRFQVECCTVSQLNCRNLTSLLANPSPTITGWGATFVGGGTVSRFLRMRMMVVMLMLLLMLKWQ